MESKHSWTAFIAQRRAETGKMTQWYLASKPRDTQLEQHQNEIEKISIPKHLSKIVTGGRRTLSSRSRVLRTSRRILCGLVWPVLFCFVVMVVFACVFVLLSSVVLLCLVGSVRGVACFLVQFLLWYYRRTSGLFRVGQQLWI